MMSPGARPGLGGRPAGYGNHDVSSPPSQDTLARAKIGVRCRTRQHSTSSVGCDSSWGRSRRPQLHRRDTPWHCSSPRAVCSLPGAVTSRRFRRSESEPESAAVPVRSVTVTGGNLLSQQRTHCGSGPAGSSCGGPRSIIMDGRLTRTRIGVTGVCLTQSESQAMDGRLGNWNGQPGTTGLPVARQSNGLRFGPIGPSESDSEAESLSRRRRSQ
jgi:hypothetical protein